MSFFFECLFIFLLKFCLLFGKSCSTRNLIDFLLWNDDSIFFEIKKSKESNSASRSWPRMSSSWAFHRWIRSFIMAFDYLVVFEFISSVQMKLIFIRISHSIISAALKSRISLLKSKFSPIYFSFLNPLLLF